MSTKTLLKNEVESELNEVSRLQIGSDEYKIAVDGVSKLVDKMVELEKFEIDRDNKDIDREFDQNFKLSQAKAEKTDRIIKNSLTAAGLVIPSALAIWGTLKTFKFEETGSVTSIIGKSFIGKLLKK